MIVQKCVTEPNIIHSNHLTSPPVQLDRSPLMAQEEEDYLVDQYSKSGFKNSLQFYQHKVIALPIAFWRWVRQLISL